MMPVVVTAQDGSGNNQGGQNQQQEDNAYQPLAPIPGVAEEGEDINLQGYLAGIFNTVIGLATVAAVVVITIGGVRYTTAGDSEDQVKSAKDQIKGAVGGLLLAAASWLILYTINPQLLNFNVGTLSMSDNMFTAQGRESDVESQLDGAVFHDAMISEEYTPPGFVFDHINKKFKYEVSGDIPSGLYVKTNETQVTLRGEPQETGEFTFRIVVTDAKGKTFDEEFTIKVINPAANAQGKHLSPNPLIGFLPAGGEPWYRELAHKGTWYDSEYVYGPYGSEEACQNQYDEQAIRRAFELKGVPWEEVGDEGCEPYH